MMTDLAATSGSAAVERRVEQRSRSGAASTMALTWAARAWFAVAVLGQWVFASYVVLFYGGAAMQGDLASWNKVMPHGYVAGDVVGNTAVAFHLLFAVAILFGGPLQLSATIRKRAPVFHRWNGRLYISGVTIMAIGGLYMVWVRGAVGDLAQHVGITGDAILVLITASMALRYAIAGNIRTHRRWALRLFIVANAVWFFRVGLMLWLLLNKGPAGFDPKTFTGPFLTIWSFADYLLPLAILEIYLRVKERAGTGGRLTMAAAMVALTVAMGIGIVVATMGMWLPRVN